MTDAEFEQLVIAGIEALPVEFQKRLANVAVVIEDEPDAQVRAEFGAELFGFYEGVPVPERGSEYSALPDRIIIYKNTVLAHYSDPTDIKECVENTVWHEVAHHFGYDEPWVAREEVRRGKIK